MFKIGNRVVFKDRHLDWYMSGVITKIVKTIWEDMGYEIVWEGNKHPLGNYYEKELLLIPEANDILKDLLDKL